MVNEAQQRLASGFASWNEIERERKSEIEKKREREREADRKREIG